MKKKEKKPWIRILKYFKNAKIGLIVMLIATMLTCFLGYFKPIVQANVITNLTNFNSDKVIKYSIILLAVSIINIIGSHIIYVAYQKGVKSKINISIQRDLMKQVLDMKTLNYDNHSSGEFSEKIMNDSEKISSVLNAAQYSFFSMVTNAVMLVYVFFINYILGLIYVGYIVVAYVYEKYAFKKVEKMTKEVRKINEKNTTLFNEMIRGIRDIKLLNIGKSIFNLVIRGQDNAIDKNNNKSIKQTTIYDVNSALQVLTEFMILFVGIICIKNNFLNATNLLIVYMYSSRIFQIVFCYTSTKEQMIEFNVAASRIFELMDNELYPKEKFGNEHIDNIKGKIEFKNLSFGYNDELILNDINMKLDPNDTVGIVGASGSGKTTLLNLLSKAYEVNDNQIFIDDIDINKLDKESIRDNVSVITQNPYIFNLTIRENLKLMDDNLTDEQMIEACKIAQIHDYIETLPDKYDTLLGESGVNLSGGQRQRLAIARALVKKTKIILFDEATSALDNITQNELQKAINNITKDYTIIIVAHRLSTIKECNKIYVINEGKIVGVGKHDELLKGNEYYKKLYEEELA